MLETMTDDDCWQEVRGKLSEAVSDEEFSNWFRSLKFEGIDGKGTAVMSVPTDFLKSWLTRNYPDALRAAWAGFESVRAINVITRKPGQEAIVEKPKPIFTAAEPEPEKSSRPKITCVPPESEPLPLRPYFAEWERIPRSVTFNSIAVGDGNAQAYDYAWDFANGKFMMHPLTITGRPGTGKTMLLDAVSNHAKRKGLEVLHFDLFNPDESQLSVIRMMSNQADIVIIDNLHAINSSSGKFNNQAVGCIKSMVDSGVKLLVSTSIAVNILTVRRPRLQSALISGLEAKLDYNCYGLKLSLFRQMLASLDVKLNEATVVTASRMLPGDANLIKGAVNYLVAHYSKKLIPFNAELEDTELALIFCDFLENISIQPTIGRIKREVAKYYGVPVSAIESRTRKTDVSLARHVAQYLARELTDHSFPIIGKQFNRDHTSIMNGWSKVRQRASEDESFNHHIQNLTEVLAP